jgi:hypothetical protein
MDSGFGELFRQLPPGIPLMFCISAILLLVAVAYMVRQRSQRARESLATAGAAPVMNVDISGGDLPDLDTLATGEVMRPVSRSGPHQVMLVGGEMVEAVEVFTVLRDVGEGGLIIRIGEKAYRNPPKSSDADFNRRYQNALRDLTAPPPTNLTPERDTNARFQPPAPPRAPEPEPEPASAPVQVVDEVTPPVAAAELDAVVDEAALPVDADSDDFDMPSEDDLAAPPLPPLNLPPKIVTGEVTPATPFDLPKFKMPDGPPVKPKRGQRPVADPIPEINIAASIEAFLQHKLAQTPQYAGRSIHVRKAAHGGVHIEVDGIFFDSVSEVTDVGVRQYLTATIEEWQSRQ